MEFGKRKPLQFKIRELDALEWWLRLGLRRIELVEREKASEQMNGHWVLLKVYLPWLWLVWALQARAYWIHSLTLFFPYTPHVKHLQHKNTLIGPEIVYAQCFVFPIHTHTYVISHTGPTPIVIHTLVFSWAHPCLFLFSLSLLFFLNFFVINL